LKRFVDEYGLYNLLGDALIRFMRIKPEPFKSNALRSQEDFWLVPAWKRALTAVFLLRFVLGYKCQKGWRSFTERDYKLNKRTFDRWIDKEQDVFNESTEFRKLPLEPPQTASPNVKKKRKLPLSEISSTESPMKRSFVVCADSTSDSE
jgi:hypothetical protein